MCCYSRFFWQCYGNSRSFNWQHYLSLTVIWRAPLSSEHRICLLPSLVLSPLENYSHTRHKTVFAASRVGLLKSQGRDSKHLGHCTFSFSLPLRVRDNFFLEVVCPCPIRGLSPWNQEHYWEGGGIPNKVVNVDISKLLIFLFFFGKNSPCHFKWQVLDVH